MPITLKVTAKGQITLRKEVLEHLGVRPGDRVDADLLKDGRLQGQGKTRESRLRRSSGCLPSRGSHGAP